MEVLFLKIFCQKSFISYVNINGYFYSNDRAFIWAIYEAVYSSKGKIQIE